MAKYDTQEVCLNGHQTTDKYYSHLETRKNFCVSCGAKQYTAARLVEKTFREHCDLRG
jgi:hypothetical protein